jgi:iduronate 2-sulfatase
MTRLLRLLPAALLAASSLTTPAHAARPNVLFIAADDLRVESLARMPNLDRLARQSRVFTNAHCQQAVCNPSRASLMTGLRPDTLRIWNLETNLRETHPDVVTLPQHFKANGYTTLNVGKIYHNWAQKLQGDPASWSAPAELHWGNHGSDQAKVDGQLPPNLAKDPKCECRDVPDEAYIDGRIAARAIEQLDHLKQAGRPFFLGVGFWKPHAPFNAPKKYWDLYQRDQIPLPDPAAWPEGADRIAWHSSREILGWDKQRALSQEAISELRHGYLAAASYLDAQIGKVLDHLDRTGLADRTVIVFWSDHGYHLGEHSLWAKTSNFELDTRVPLLVRLPGMKSPGTPAAAPVELLDLYPTLVESCGLPPVQNLEGRSLTPILTDPSASVKEAAISQFPRPNYPKGRPDHMGYSARSATHRYTEWRDWTTGEVKARELYDHRNDPQETHNLAADPSADEVIKRHATLLPPAQPHPLPAGLPAPPPGTVIHHQPSASRIFIGSPSLCIAPDGSYLASHDFFGPKSGEYQLASGRVHRSTDKGLTWSPIADLRGFFWTGLFVHQGAVHALGTDRHHGRLILRRSTDSGHTWSQPTELAAGQWHTAPVPVIEHGGRLWRAAEDAENGTKWGERYRARMLSIPIKADPMIAANWTISNPLARDPAWLEGRFAAWLEGNAVLAPDGRMINLLRVDVPTLPERAAIIRVSDDGTTATFDPATGFIEMPGGAKKFTVRKDPAGPGYWTVASVVPTSHAGSAHPAAIRNTLALLHSTDLRQWDLRTILLRHPDAARHGFQYVDWLFDGSDLIAACRTAWDDATGGAPNHHDANFLTFHRWKHFRNLTRSDDAALPETGHP